MNARNVQRIIWEIRRSFNSRPTPLVNREYSSITRRNDLGLKVELCRKCGSITSQTAQFTQRCGLV